MVDAPFLTWSFSPPTGPVILSVAHAGRNYETAMLADLRVPMAAVRPLEDRYADLLIDDAIHAGVPAIIATSPRLAIDLNRAPDDLDPQSIRNGAQTSGPASAKARAGLGLVPTRLWGVGPLWRAPFEPQEIAARIASIHAPYHAAIARALRAANRRWGAALLIDVHSMPPIKADKCAPDMTLPDIVIGDRFGASASARLTATAEAIVTASGWNVALNTPYAGGYVVARHAQPQRNIHALQIEIDRRLYLDAAFDHPAPGLARVQRMILDLVTALSDELTSGVLLAAE